MSQVYACFITKDINKKLNRKNWLDGTLEFCAETEQISIKNEFGKFVSGTTNKKLFDEFMNRDIVKIGSFEVELDESRNIQQNESKKAKWKRTFKSFKKTKKKRNDYKPKQSSFKQPKPPRNNFEKYVNEKEENDDNSYQNIHFNRSHNDTFNNRNKCFQPIRANENNERKRSFHQMNDAMVEDAVVLTGTILDYIEIDKEALAANGDEIYKKHNVAMEKETNQIIPKMFEEPWFLPIYSEKPHVVTQSI